MGYSRIITGMWLLTIVLLTSCQEEAKEPTKGTTCLPPAGFRVAYFDRTGLLDGINPQADRMRFYGVRRSANDNEGTVMAIAVDGAGVELPDRDGRKNYRMYERSHGADISLEHLESTRACQNLFHMLYSDKAGCVSEMSMAQINGLMRDGAMKVVPVELEGVYTMKFIPIAFNNGQEVEGSAIQTCAQPCPRMCGRYENFVCL